MFKIKPLKINKTKNDKFFLFFFDFLKVNELISNDNNHKFWDTFKSMNEINLPYNDNKNPTNKLYDHFKKLHSAPDPNTLSAFQINTLEDKKSLENSNHLQSELADNPISFEEIGKAIKKLKNKKAAGLDRIRNEMIKTSSGFIKYSLKKLLNLILQSGIFPTSWTNGIITALNKSGNKDDPSNYRGICISSCLGKLFCSILNMKLLNFFKQS